MVPDEPLLSPKRLWFAFWMWVFWQRMQANGSLKFDIPLLHLLRYHRRPGASDRDGVY